jgi:hypothetical protein
MPYEQHRRKPTSARRLKNAPAPRPTTPELVHPETPEAAASVASLPVRDRLITLHAIQIVFPRLLRSSQWKARIAEARAALKPGTVELAEILKAARQQSARPLTLD